jgi:alanine-synthesizing transaminase
MIFSDIVQRFDSPLNALYAERDRLRRRGTRIADLVSGNVNQAGFIFPPEILKKAMLEGLRRTRVYTPDPLGQLAARSAVERFYRNEGLKMPASHMVLTPGTSLSYAYLFKLLTNPGDEILCPTPSYPLLDSIAEWCHARLTTYRLSEGTRWEIDFDSLTAAITPQTRAIVLISPHNPTGAVATPDEVSTLASIAAERGLPIISDEVFSPFIFQKGPLPRPAHHAHTLVFTLNGISKLFALPGMKLGWIGVTGPSNDVQKALKALDMISDTFLPVNEGVQLALPTLLSKGRAFQTRFAHDVQLAAEKATSMLRDNPEFSFIPPEGGFYLTMKLRDGLEEEKVALKLLQEIGLLTHPGYFYDLEGNHLVISFVHSPKQLKTYLTQLVRALGCED